MIVVPLIIAALLFLRATRVKKTIPVPYEGTKRPFKDHVEFVDGWASFIVSTVQVEQCPAGNYYPPTYFLEQYAFKAFGVASFDPAKHRSSVVDGLVNAVGLTNKGIIDHNAEAYIKAVEEHLPKIPDSLISDLFKGTTYFMSYFAYLIEAVEQMEPFEISINEFGQRLAAR